MASARRQSCRKCSRDRLSSPGLQAFRPANDIIFRCFRKLTKSGKRTTAEIRHGQTNLYGRFVCFRSRPEGDRRWQTDPAVAAATRPVMTTAIAHARAPCIPSRNSTTSSCAVVVQRSRTRPATSAACIGCDPSFWGIKYLTWTDENLLRQVVYQGLREDQRAVEMRRPVPYPKSEPPKKPTAPAKVGGTNLCRSARAHSALLPDAVVPSRGEFAAYWETVAMRRSRISAGAS